MSYNTPKPLSIKIFYYYIPLLLWMGVIFYFSSQPGSGHPIKNWHFYAERKGAHIFEYFLLSILFLRVIFIKIQTSIFRKKHHFSYLAALIFSFSYAVFDELHQFFIFGREGKISDVGIDVIGIILALSVYRIVRK